MQIIKKAFYADERKRDILREDLRQNLLDKYKVMRTKGVVQYHFVFKDNVSFLRMHKPSKYGDNITNYRADIAIVNKNLKPIRGFEQAGRPMPSGMCTPL